MQSRGVWVLLALLISVGLVAGVVRYTSVRARAAMVTVPDILGMRSESARQTLRGLGLGYRQVGSNPSDSVAEDAVLRQDPAPGVEVIEATVVKVVLSGGPSHVLVPDVTQMSVAAAHQQLEEAGLATGLVNEAYDDEIPAGYVASTLPASGARVVRGTAVDIVLSLGPEPTAPTGPALPGPSAGTSGREETLNYVVPADISDKAEVEVTIELADQRGSRRIYQGRHRPGDRIPAQKIKVTTPTTARILVDGKLQGTREYLP